MIVTVIKCNAANCSTSQEIDTSKLSISLPSGWFAVANGNDSNMLVIKKPGAETAIHDKHYCGITCCNKGVASLLLEDNDVKKEMPVD